MRPTSLFSLFILFTLPLIACGLFQPGFTATQTAVMGTTVAASWTDTPVPTLTPMPTETETPTFTPDPCAAENLSDAVDEVHDLQIKFDDLSGKAANTEREELHDQIVELQELLQTALDQDTPPCLETLRDHQVKHMNLVIDTLLAFERGEDRATIDEGIENARQEYDAYTLELERLRDIEIGTVTPAP